MNELIDKFNEFQRKCKLYVEVTVDDYNDCVDHEVWLNQCLVYSPLDSNDEFKEFKDSLSKSAKEYKKSLSSHSPNQKATHQNIALTHKKHLAILASNYIPDYDENYEIDVNLPIKIKDDVITITIDEQDSYFNTPDENKPHFDIELIQKYAIEIYYALLDIEAFLEAFTSNNDYREKHRVTLTNDKEEIIKTLSFYFDPSDKSNLEKLLNGQLIESPIDFKRELNKLIDCLGRLQENGIIILKKVELNEWIIQNFTWKDEPIKASTLTRKMSKTDGDRCKNPIKYFEKYPSKSQKK